MLGRVCILHFEIELGEVEIELEGVACCNMSWVGRVARMGMQEEHVCRDDINSQFSEFACRIMILIFRILVVSYSEDVATSIVTCVSDSNFVCWSRYSECLLASCNMALPAPLPGAIVVRPKPEMGSGYRSVWISKTKQWLVHIGTGEMIEEDFDGKKGAVVFALDEEDQAIVLAGRQCFEIERSWPIMIGPLTPLGGAFKLFDLQLMQRNDGTHFFYNVRSSVGKDPDFAFKEKTY